MTEESIFDEIDPEAAQKSEVLDIQSRVNSIPINYIGNKKKLLPHLFTFLRDNDIDTHCVLDIFGGSGVFSAAMSMTNKRCIYNDLLVSSSLRALFVVGRAVQPGHFLSDEELNLLLTRKPNKVGAFVFDRYANKLFDEKEAVFLDTFRQNIIEVFGSQLAVGIKQQAHNNLFESIDIATPYFSRGYFGGNQTSLNSLNPVKASLAMLAMINLINSRCFLGGRYYSGQTLAKYSHRLDPEGKNGVPLYQDPIKDMGMDKIARYLKETKTAHVEVLNLDAMDAAAYGVSAGADLAYIDPPYGGDSSDYAGMYRFLEEYVHLTNLEEIKHISDHSHKFKSPKEYRDYFENLLAKMTGIATWLLSFNASSWASLEDIVASIQKFKCNVKFIPVEYGYNYRGGKNDVSEQTYLGEDFGVSSKGHKFNKKDSEYLILAQ